MENWFHKNSKLFIKSKIVDNLFISINLLLAFYHKQIEKQSISFRVSFSYLNTIGYENTSSDQLILKSGSSVDCKATKNSTGFVFHLVGSDVYNCAKAYNVRKVFLILKS